MSSNRQAPVRLRLAASRDEHALARARCKALAEYQILDTPREHNFDAVAELAARVCQTQFAAISFLSDDRQWFKAEFGLGLRETPIGQSFCAHAIRGSGLFVVNDAREHPSFADNQLVQGDPNVRFYAGVPLKGFDGQALGALCVIDTHPRPAGVDDLQQATLEVLASQIEAQLELRRAILDRDRHAAEQCSLAEELRWTAEHDVLTGLPNRALFQKRLEEALDVSDRDATRVALVLVDVDHFKQVNDSLGHDAGDALLQAFAKRLRACVRADDTVARLGGDEFALVLPGLGAEDDIDRLVNSLGERLRKPLRYDGNIIQCRASVGIAVCPDHATSAAVLTKCADLALGASKAGGRARASTFRPDMAEHLRYKNAALRDARQALECDEIAFHYQPKVDLRTGRLAGFEALLRWEKGDGRVELPMAIGAAFEDPELSAAISERLVDKVLADMTGWVEAGLDFGHVAINTCAADFAGNNFAERLLGALAERDLKPAVIEVEVTEDVFLGRGNHHVQRALSVLHAAGVRIALDDFGTGYASLSHLKQFPVDVLKIDRSFVAGLGCNEDDEAIVRALIQLGESLGIQTVAEGVETPEQADYVRSVGCDFGQGFLFGRAQAGSDVPALVEHFARQVSGSQ